MIVEDFPSPSTGIATEFPQPSTVAMSPQTGRTAELLDERAELSARLVDDFGFRVPDVDACSPASQNTAAGILKT